MCGHQIRGRQHGRRLIHVFRPNLILDVRAGGLRKPTTFDQSNSEIGIGPMKQLGFDGVDQWGGMFANLVSPWITGDIGKPQ